MCSNARLYTLEKYWACGSDLAEHGRDRIDHGAGSNRAHRKLPNGVQIALPSTGLPGVAVASRCRARGATRAWGVSRLAMFLG